MKILILGGLGYIGSALADLYRADRDAEVILMDNRFVPERVATFPGHFRYVHADMNDLDLVRHLARDVDVVHMLAAQVEAESSAERSDLVWRENFELPKAVIEAVPASARVLFPSSCNVFGGIAEGQKWQGLTEEDPPSPKLPYAETKKAMEEFLRASNRNFTLVRFATNYGYSAGVRFNLVTNIFTKNAIEGRALKLHGGGLNHRPTVCVQDCARALRFLAEREDAAGELFHVVNRAYSIHDLAHAVVAAVGDTGARVVNVEKQVPFNSYAPVADKIKALGFTFEWSLERAVKDMAARFHALRSPLIASDGAPARPTG